MPPRKWNNDKSRCIKLSVSDPADLHKIKQILVDGRVRAKTCKTMPIIWETVQWGLADATFTWKDSAGTTLSGAHAFFKRLIRDEVIGRHFVLVCLATAIARKCSSTSKYMQYNRE
jgi:hypothetical protein